MYGFIGNIGPWELAFILLVALIVVGPGKLPEVARSLGRAANEFRRVTTGVRKEFQDAMRFDDVPNKTTTTSRSTATYSTNVSDDENVNNNEDVSNTDTDSSAETENKTTEEHNP